MRTQNDQAQARARAYHSVVLDRVGLMEQAGAAGDIGRWQRLGLDALDVLVEWVNDDAALGLEG